MKGVKSVSSACMVLIFAIAMLYCISGCEKMPSWILSPEKIETEVQKEPVASDLYLCSSGGSLAKADVDKIGPEGGTVGTGGHMLVIPAGALDENVRIKMHMAGSQPMAVSLTPDGLSFNQSATLTLDYSNTDYHGLDETNFSIVCLDDGSTMSSWVDTGSKTVTCSIDHFSRYAISKGCF